MEKEAWEVISHDLQPWCYMLSHSQGMEATSYVFSAIDTR